MPGQVTHAELAQDELEMPGTRRNIQEQIESLTGTQPAGRGQHRGSKEDAGARDRSPVRRTTN